MKPSPTAVLDIIEDRLKNISESNGYSCTPKSIRRASLTPFKSHDLPAVNYWPDGLNFSAPRYSHNLIELTLSIEAHALTRDEAFSDVADRLAIDIITAIDRSPLKPRTDDDPSYNLGGAAASVRIESMQYEIGQGQTPWCGVLLIIKIQYRNARLNDLQTYRA